MDAESRRFGFSVRAEATGQKKKIIIKILRDSKALFRSSHSREIFNHSRFYIK